MRMVKKIFFAAVAALLILASFSGCGSNSVKETGQKGQQVAKRNEEVEENKEAKEMMKAESKPETQTEPVDNLKSKPKLKYLGHSSIRIITTDSKVIYIDPYAGDDYAEPADIVLVTHSHNDHNNVDKVKKKDDCIIITYKEALKGGKYQSFDVSNIKINSTPAYNKNHPKGQCVGYVIEFEGIKLYHAGDTSKINEMAELSGMNITYALLPMDNVYNMGPEEAAECAKIINAKYNIPIHTGPNGVYSQENIDKFNVDNKIVLKPKEIIELNTK